MKAALSFTVLGLLALAGTYGFTHHAEMPGFPIGILFRNTFMLVKMAEIILGLILLLVVVVGLLQLATDNSGKPSSFLSVIMWLSAALGAAAALYGAAVIHTAIVNTNTTNTRVWAPSAAEALFALTIGLLVAAVAAWINAGVAGKRRKSAA